MGSIMLSIIIHIILYTIGAKESKILAAWMSLMYTELMDMVDDAAQGERPRFCGVLSQNQHYTQVILCECRLPVLTLTDHM